MPAVHRAEIYCMFKESPSLYDLKQLRKAVVINIVSADCRDVDVEFNAPSIDNNSLYYFLEGLCWFCVVST